MSEPTYRIEVEHYPADRVWMAQAYQVSNGQYVSGSTGSGDTPEAALADTQARLAAMAQSQPTQRFYVEEDGTLFQPTPEPQSLRA